MLRCEKCDVYVSGTFCPMCRAKERELAKPEPVVIKRRNQPRVGQILKSIIPTLLQYKGCGCGSYAKKMDRWGIEGCEKRKEEIVAHLVNQAKKLKVPKAVSGAMARRWVEKAISKAKEQDVER